MKKQLILTYPFALIVLTFAVCFSQSPDTLFGFRAGYYQGNAFNSTANARGKVVFQLFDIDPKNGNVQAYFAASEGLEGEAWLTGKITDSGELNLMGTLASYTMKVHGHLTANGTITADYSLEGPNTQRGNFEVSFIRAIAADISEDNSFRTSAISTLIGAWEVGGALPAQTDPLTGRSYGVSFVDVHQLDFFPDGRFKHLWSHRHCEGGNTCCSEQAMLEEGTFALTGSRLDLTVTGGNLIVTGTCNPRLNGHTPVKHGTFTYNISVREGAGSTQLCLQQSSQTATCYKKQS